MKWFRKYSTYLAKMIHEMINKRLHQPGWYHLKKTSSTFNISWCTKEKKKKKKKIVKVATPCQITEKKTIWSDLVYIWSIFGFSLSLPGTTLRKNCFVLKIFIFFCIFDESTNFKICDAIIGIIAH